MNMLAFLMNMLVKNRRLGSALGALAVVVLLAGCSSAGNGSHAQVLPQMGMPTSVSPALIHVAPMTRTAIQPRSAMHSPPSTAIDIQGLNWTQIPGAATQAAAAADGSLWVLSTAPSGANKYIWHYVNGTWTNITGLASQLAVAPNGTLYAINSGGGTYAYSGGNWTALGGGASWITAAADNSIYVLSNGGAGPDQAIWHNVAGVWSQMPGSGVSLAGSFDTGYYMATGGTIAPGGVYIVNSLGSIYYENAGGGFATLPANTSALAPTQSGGVFALSYPANAGGNTIYYDNLNSTASGWSTQSGAGISLSSNAGELYVIGASGAIYASPVTATPTSGGTIAEYQLPTSQAVPSYIAAGADGNLWFTEYNADKIGKITTSGTVTEYVIPTSFAMPEGIAAGPDGNLWFTEYNGNKIGKITTSGTITEYPTPTTRADPWAIAAGTDGNLWFTERFANNIGKITTNGTITEYPIPTASANPGDITAGPDGNLWFVENTSEKIGAITPSGTITEYLVPTSNADPYGIVAGPDGNLWFT